MKIKGTTYFLMAILAALLVLIVTALGMAPWRSKALPLMIGGITFVAAAIELVRELRKGREPSKDSKTAISAEERRGYLVSGMWIVGYLVAILLVGFNIANALFVLTYMKLHGASWLQGIVYTVVTVAVLWGGFQYFMQVELYPGIIFKMFD